MGTIYCIGRNYVKHAQELGNEIPASPVVFLKSPSSLRGLSPSPLAFPDETFHHEIEIVLRMGDHQEIDAFGLGIDLTRRTIQNELKAKGLPWTLAKSFQGSAILGELRPFVAGDHRFELFVGGELRQSGDTRNMIFPFPELIRFIDSFSPLRKGDLIYTGTPEGVGPLRRGDRFELVLDGSIREAGEL